MGRLNVPLSSHFRERVTVITGQIVSRTRIVFDTEANKIKKIIPSIGFPIGK